MGRETETAFPVFTQGVLENHERRRRVIRENRWCGRNKTFTPRPAPCPHENTIGLTPFTAREQAVVRALTGFVTVEEEDVAAETVHITMIPPVITKWNAFYGGHAYNITFTTTTDCSYATHYVNEYQPFFARPNDAENRRRPGPQRRRTHGGKVEENHFIIHINIRKR